MHVARKPDAEPVLTELEAAVIAVCAGFDRLCVHVWRIEGHSEGMAGRKPPSLIGTADLSALAYGDHR